MSKQIEHDELVPDPVMRREFGVTEMTISRWDADPKLGFPPKIKIRAHNFRSRKQLEEFKARMLTAAIKARSKRATAGLA